MDHVFTIIAGLILSIVTALVTVRLALGRFRAERLWVRRVDAYQAVLEALHHASRDCRVERANYQSPPKHQPSEDERRNIHEAYAEIAKAIDLGSFLLSDEAATCLNKLEKGLREAREPGEDFLGHIKDSEDAINDCLGSLRDIAKKDIKK